MQRALSVPIWPPAHVPAVPRLWGNCKLKYSGGTPENTIHLGLPDSVVPHCVFYLRGHLHTVADILQISKRLSSEFVFITRKGLGAVFFFLQFLCILKAGSSKLMSYKI